MNFLEVRNLKKSYKEATGRLEVLKDINMEISSGDLIALTGRSGSGKSTLMHILGMLDNADSGEIFYFDRKMSVAEKRINEFRNKTIGFIFQFHYLLEDFTAEENVAMPMFLSSKNFKKSIAKAQRLLKTLDLIDRKDHYPNQLSGGEQQRVAVARALINEPQIIFADEPTGNLDKQHSDELIDLLIEINKSKTETIVIATHNIQIAQQMNRHFHLKEGYIREM